MFYVADQAGHRDAPKVNHIYVSAGSLSSAIDDRPTAHVSYEEHVRWIEDSDALPKFVAKSEVRMG
jgi:hypothetical protein